MSRQEQIKCLLERNAKAVALRPGVGQGTAVTRQLRVVAPVK